MTPKKVDYNDLCKTQLHFDPYTLSKLANTYPFFYRTVFYPQLDNELFAPMYSSSDSRPATSPAFTMSLMTLVSEYRLSHEEALESLQFDARFQLATNTLGMAADKIPGSIHSIARFEGRAHAYSTENNVPNPIDQAYKNLRVVGLALSGMDLHTLRSDSMQVSGNFAVKDREGLVLAAIFTLADYLLAYGTDAQKEAIRQSKGLKKFDDVLFTPNAFSYHYPESIEKKRAMLCSDASEVLALLSEKDKEDKGVALCVKVLGQQTRVEDGKRVFIPKGDDALKEESLIQSLLDADATYREKNHKHYRGYVLDSMEAVNGLTHMPIFSSLRPNKTADADMDKEFYKELPALSEELDAFYAKYPALKKGDPYACQCVLQGILTSMRQDFVREGTTLYEMNEAGLPVVDILAQQKKFLAVLDSFYDRLAHYQPTPPEEAPAPQGKDGASEPVEKSAPSGEDPSGTLASDSQKPTFNRSWPDWMEDEANLVDWSDPDFADKPDDYRRSFYLFKVASKPENYFALPKGANIVVSDGAYSPAAQAAKAAGYVLMTTNSLGKKANPIIALFEKEGEDYTKCPKGNPVAKYSVHADGKVWLWMEGSYCSDCPCAKDCKAKEQKRSGLFTLSIDPHSIPALVSEAATLTDDYQELGDIRNGVECLMSYYRNYYRCDKWPIGMATKQRLAQLMTTTTCIKNLWLFFKGETRVHLGRLFGTKKD